MKLWNPAGRGRSVASLPLPFPLPFIIFILSSSTSPSLPPPLPSLPAATCRQATVPAIFSPAILLLPFFFIKLPSGSVAVAAWRGAPVCWPSQPAQLQRHPARRALALPAAACPLPSSLSPASRCGPSAAIRTIGKQRLKMNYSVSSSSLMNK